jgi:hypothetical protein
VIRSHAALVRGILLAIHEALSLIRLKDPRVIEAGAKALWCKRPIVERALKRALEEDLFPYELAVDRTAWRNAVEVYHDASGKARPSSRTVNETFNKYVDRHPSTDIFTYVILPRVVGRSAVQRRDLIYTSALLAPPRDWSDRQRVHDITDTAHCQVYVGGCRGRYGILGIRTRRGVGKLA